MLLLKFGITIVTHVVLNERIYITKQIFKNDAKFSLPGEMIQNKE